MARRPSAPSDAPLLAWGDSLRAARIRQHTLRRQAGFITAGIAIIGLTIALPPRPRLIWNASASAPIGLYAVSPSAPVDTGDMVIARVPARFRDLAARRHYIPANVPLVKRVVGAAGDDVCALATAIFTNGRRVAERRPIDGEGRPMPWWNGCVRLRGRQLFLLMTDSPASFDGRYFGSTEAADVIGKAHALWTR